MLVINIIALTSLYISIYQFIFEQQLDDVYYISSQFVTTIMDNLLKIDILIFGTKHLFYLQVNNYTDTMDIEHLFNGFP